MKKRNIILTALTSIFAFSASIFAAFGGVKPVTPNVQAADDQTTYWEQYFDVQSEGDVTFTSNYQKPSYYAGNINSALGGISSGLGVTFFEDTTLTYKTPILVDALSKSINLIEFLPAPLVQCQKTGDSSSADDAEFSTSIIRLTSVEDENEYIEIKHFRSNYNPALSWALVSTNTMAPAGFKKGVIDATEDKGTPITGSYTGRIYGNGNNAQPFAFQYDSNSNIVYTRLPLYNDTAYGVENGTIRELSNPGHLLGSDALFTGFKSKYVKLSIKFTNIFDETNPSHVILTQVLNQPLTSATFVDGGKPSLIFPANLESTELPVGEVNSKYPYWNIEAFDAIEGNLTNDISYKVEYLGEKDDQSPAVVNVEYVDGGFIPKAKGFYQVTASVKDSSNNNADVIVKKMQVLPVVETINLVFEDNAIIPTEASVGARIVIPDAIITGGSGELNVNFSVTYNNRSVNIPVIANAFNVEYAGVYNVTYVVTDYLGTERVFDYPITTKLSDKPIFEDIVIPKAYKKYSTIDLNLPKAYDFASFPGQKMEVPVQIQVREVILDGGVEVDAGSDWVTLTADELTGKYSYYPENDNVVKLKVRYVASALLNQEAVNVSEPKVIALLDPASLDGYWFNNDGKISSSYEAEAGLNFKENYFTVLGNGATLDYIVPVQAEGFSLGMIFDPGQAFFKKITVSLTDSENINQVVTFTITKRSETEVYLSTPYATYASTLGKMYNADKSSTVLIKFKLGYQLVDSFGSLIANITKYDNGDAYTKFDSGKALVKVVFDEIDTTDGKVNKVRFGQFYSQYAYLEGDLDSNGPIIATSSHINTYYSYMQELVLPTANAYDLYCPYSEVYLRVTNPDGDVIVNNVLANVEHKIILDKNGRYSIEYYSADDYDNRTFISYNVFTLDVIKPVIEIDGQIKSTVKVGEALQLPNYFVSDNVTDPKDMLKYVYLETPSFGYKTIAIGDNFGTYKFQQAGTYKLVYFAMDKSSNYSYKTFTITVIN